MLGSQLAGGFALVSVLDLRSFDADRILVACVFGALFGAGFGNIVGLFTRNRFSNRPDDPTG